ncbi:MAG: hypothetical protein IPM56_00585 [Ignavibacteriales bacterium]|nr:MAG: hypothetical protein IPM56_00585 [Ignavibacteriales bacterium]
MNMRFILSVMILVFIFSEKIFPQFYLGTSFENYYDDNIFNNYTRVSDFVNNLSGEAGYDFETARNNFELYYSGNYNYYNTNITKTSSSHKFGIVETYLFADDDNPLNIGANYGFRSNREEFSVYDYGQFSAYANYMHSISEADKLQGGLIFNKIDFKNYSLFSYNEYKFFVKSIFSFETGTSLIIGAELDHKQYSEKLNDPEMAETVTQSKFLLQSGQSLTDELGVSAYLLYRKNLKSGNRFFNVDDFVYYEEEIFNDVYSNEGYETGLSITYLISQTVTGKVEGRYQVGNYLNLPAATADGTELNYNRKDKLYAIGSALQINLNSFISGMNLYLNYNILLNESNDYFYDYSNQLFSFGLGWDL